jgi:hypothetical protein
MNEDFNIQMSVNKALVEYFGLEGHRLCHTDRYLKLEVCRSK